MAANKSHELPIRAKKEMARDIANIIQCLHQGRQEKAAELIEFLKIRSVHLPEQIQQDVLAFAEQIQFQFAYDPWHKVTYDIQMAADNLLEDLGLINPHFRHAS
jgi:hypothetical protein